MKKKKIFQLTFSILFSTLLVVSLVYAWTAPTQNPPNDNVEAPINVSDAAQSKLGNFGLGGGAGQPLYWLKNIGGTLYFSSTNPAGDRIVIGQDGKVGIGAPGPAEKLEVSGAIKIGTTSNTNAGTIRWTGTDFEGYTGSNWVSLTSGGGGLWTDQGTYIYPNNYNQFVIEDTGKVGIGTTGPKERLHIGGTKGATFHDGGDKALSWNAYYNAGWKYIGDDFATQIYTSYNKDKLYIRTAPSGTAGNAISWNDGITIDSNGNVGIGTTGPESKLDVAGTLAIRQGYGSGIYAPYNYGSINFARANNDNAFLYPYIGNNSLDLRLYLQDDGTERFSIWGDSCHNGGCSQGTTNAALGAYIQGNGQAYFKGKVGIGTMGPGAKLDVEYPLNTTGLELTSPNYDGDRLNAGLRFHSNTNTGAQGDVVFYHNGKEGAAVDIWGYPSNSAGGCCHHLATFGVKNNGSNYQYFSGNVGIGTTNPQGKLHIKAAGSKVIIEI